jgi:hypothetical protein
MQLVNMYIAALFILPPSQVRCRMTCCVTPDGVQLIPAIAKTSSPTLMRHFYSWSGRTELAELSREELSCGARDSLVCRCVLCQVCPCWEG